MYGKEDKLKKVSVRISYCLFRHQIRHLIVFINQLINVVKYVF